MRRPPAGALAALGLAVLWPLRRVLAGEVLYYRDIHITWLAYAEGLVRALAAGAVPLWNPLPSFGQPLLGNPAYMAAYPFTWLNLLLPAPLWYTLFAAVHLLGAGLGCFVLARRWRASPPAALVAGALWILSGPLLSLVSLWHHFASACWMPWVFAAADRALLTRRARHAAVWALAAGLQMLAGSADVVAMTLLAIALYAAVYRVRWRRWSSPATLRTVWVGLGTVALAVGVGAVQWATALDLLRHSGRWSNDPAARTYWSVHPLSLLQTVTPFQWQGLPLHPLLGTRLFEAREPFLDSLYLGLATLPLAGAALAHRRPRSVFLAALVLGALLVSLGHYSSFYYLLVAVLPPLHVLRFPVKAWILGSFAWAMLSGLGVEAWRAAGTARRRRWVAAVLYPTVLAGVLCLAAAAAGRWATARVEELVLWPGARSAPAEALLAPVAGRLALAAAVALACVVLAERRFAATGGHRGLAAAAAALALADLAAANAGLVATAPARLYARPPVVDALRSDHVARLYSYDYFSTFRARFHLDRNGRPELARRPEGWPEGAALALAQQLQLTPSTANRWQIETGFEPDRLRLFPRDMLALGDALDATEGTPLHVRLLEVAGISHVVALHHEALDGLRPVAALPGLYAPPIMVAAVPAPVPRAFAVAGARVGEGEDALRQLLEPGFDPSTEVVVSGPGAEAAPPGRAGSVALEERAAGRLAAHAQMERAGYVVVTDAFDPGWRAWVDGRPQPVLRANLAFRALRVPAGAHRVEMRYRPRGAVWGAAMSLASLAAAALLAWRG